MKKQAYTIIGALVLGILFTISTAKAQPAKQQLVANIPFKFSVGGKTLSAGKYTVTIANPSSDQRVIRIRNLETNETAMLRMHSKKGKGDEGAKLVFNRYGTHYFLAQTWTAADSIGMEASKTSTERAARKELGGTTRRTETVALRSN